MAIRTLGIICVFPLCFAFMCSDASYGVMLLLHVMIWVAKEPLDTNCIFKWEDLFLSKNTKNP